MDEMYESAKICQQVLRDMPKGGDILAGKPQYTVRVPSRRSVRACRRSQRRTGYYVVSQGKNNAYRYHIRAPSFINLTILGERVRAHKIADVVVILGSIDIVLGETDR